MSMALAFGKGKRGGLVSFVKEANTFDNYEDKIILIILKSNNTKGKDIKGADAIDATLFDVYIYCKDGKLTKAVGQCTNSGGVEVEKSNAQF